MEPPNLFDMPVDTLDILHAMSPHSGWVYLTQPYTTRYGGATHASIHGAQARWHVAFNVNWLPVHPLAQWAGRCLPSVYGNVSRHSRRDQRSTTFRFPHAVQRALC